MKLFSQKLSLFALFISAFMIVNPVHAQTLDKQIEACQAERVIAPSTLPPSDEEILEAMNEEAKNISDELAVVHIFQTGFESVVSVMETVLFFELFPETLGYPELDENCEVNQRGFPFVVFWLILGGVYFTLRLFFVNIRLFGHGLAVVTNKYLCKDDVGQVTPFQSLAAAVSGTVGLGNIAGVAVAITMGGPGAIFWMMVAGFLGMSTKFAEVTLGHKYRRVGEDGSISGGAFYYLRDGLKELGMAGIGKALALLFAILCLCGAFGGGNMFQANQMVAALTNTFDLSDLDWVIALVMAVAVGIVLIGGVKRIASVAEAIVPLMAMIYIGAATVVLVVNADKVPGALALMFDAAFSLESAAGGIFGAMIMGFRRAAFSNEAGVGSAPIVMAATKCNEPVQVGSVAILEPFIDTMIICFMTGLVITVTGVYQEGSADGVVLTSQSFATVIDWFPIVLSVAVSLFAFSTMLTWSYYGERAWSYLFKGHKIRLYHVLFCVAVFFGGAMQDDANRGFDLIVNFSDLSLLAMSIPNLIGLYLLTNVLKREMKDYRERLKKGEVKLSDRKSAE
jgi:AGCS family alanine or glycine:cation symporter